MRRRCPMSTRRRSSRSSTTWCPSTVCIAADLYGQVASESSGLTPDQRHGRPARFSHGRGNGPRRQGVICMTSTFTDKQGTRRSRILPHFGGDIVTSPRSQAYYLATEYGVVNLAGRKHVGARRGARVHCAPGLSRCSSLRLPRRRRSGAGARNVKYALRCGAVRRFHLFSRAPSHTMETDKGVIGANFRCGPANNRSLGSGLV